MNILFVCSRNQWRSPTGEAIYRDTDGIHARSAGTAPSARIRLSAKMVDWADIIFAMEKDHRRRILENFPEEAAGKEMIVLNIPDEYAFMDEELIKEIKAGVAPYLP